MTRCPPIRQREIAGSSVSRDLSSLQCSTLVFESSKVKFGRVVRQNNAKRLIAVWKYRYMFSSFSRCIVPLLWFFCDFDPRWRTQYIYFEVYIYISNKRPGVIRFVSLWSTTVPNVAINSENPINVRNWFPCRVNYSLWFSKSPIHCSGTLAGVYFNSLARLAEQKKCHGRLPLVGAIMSTCLVVSKYSV